MNFINFIKRITFFTFLLISFASIGQDLIVKKDGTIIKSKILEVTDEQVKYKKFDNADGPIYVITLANITAINYENGTVEKFEQITKSAKNENEDEDKVNEEEEPMKNNPVLQDEQLKRTIEGIAKDVGEQLLRDCANGKIDNSVTSIYWDGVFKDALSGELNIPIVTSWKPKWSEGDNKWIKGKIVITTDGRRKWVYQNDHGLTFSGCAKQFRIIQN
jgi:hypothetical protein